MVGEILSNIKRIRKEKNISQEKLAKGLKLDYSSYGKIERGITSLYTDHLGAIVKTLDIKPSELYPDLKNFDSKKLLPNIRRIRKEKNFKLIVIAEQLEIDQSTYRKIEKGDIRLTVDRLEKIARIFDVKVGEIF